MEKAMQDIFDNDLAYSYNPNLANKYANPKTILLGKQGCGKTTLYNKVTGSEEDAGDGENSITQNIFLKVSTLGDCAFEIADNPGANGSENKRELAALLKLALTMEPLSRILIQSY